LKETSGTGVTAPVAGPAAVIPGLTVTSRAVIPNNVKHFINRESQAEVLRHPLTIVIGQNNKDAGQRGGNYPCYSQYVAQDSVILLTKILELPGSSMSFEQLRTAVNVPSVCKYTLTLTMLLICTPVSGADGITLKCPVSVRI
jgi:hypothetical protein